MVLLMTDVSPDGRASRRPLHLLAVLCLLMAFAAISIDLYLPAMPAMGLSLHASPGMVEYTISGYLIGFSIGQLFWGPVSDRFGRRLPISAGLVLFIVGSVGCASSGNVPVIIFWRVLQALGACASVVLARAMVRDLYSGMRAAQMMSTLMAVMAIAPMVGPIIGGQIAVHAGWRAIFWTMAGVGVFTILALATIPETLPPAARQQVSLLRFFGQYGSLMRRRKILGYTFSGACFYAVMFAYIAGTPFAYITYHHISPQMYGVFFAVVTLGITGGNILNARLVRRYSVRTMLRIGATVASLAGIVLFFTSWSDVGGIWGLFLPLFFIISCNGLVYANTIAGALADVPQQAGAVSAIVGAVQYGCGILGSALVGILSDGTPRPMCWVIGCCAILGLCCTQLIRSPRV